MIGIDFFVNYFPCGFVTKLRFWYHANLSELTSFPLEINNKTCFLMALEEEKLTKLLKFVLF